MPNRIIKESICYSEDIDKLTPFEETVFYRLIVNVDDYGRIDGRTAFLKSKLFATKDGVTLKNIEDAIAKLASVGLVELYSVEEKPFLLFPKWELHQTIRAKKSKYPSPENIGKHLRADASRCSRNPIQSESNPNPNPNPNACDIKAFSEYESLFGTLSRLVIDSINSWIVDDGVSDDAIIYTMQRAHADGKRFAWIRTVIESNAKQGYKTLAEFKEQADGFKPKPHNAENKATSFAEAFKNYKEGGYDD